MCYRASETFVVLYDIRLVYHTKHGYTELVSAEAFRIVLHFFSNSLGFNTIIINTVFCVILK